MFRTILVPTDGSACAEVAVIAAIEFCRCYGCRLVALSVAEPHHMAAVDESSAADAAAFDALTFSLAKQHVEKVQEAARQAKVPCEISVVHSFNPADEIMKAAMYFGCEVIFIATHGRTGLSKLFAGSQTQKVLEESSIPVVVFPTRK